MNLEAQEVQNRIKNKRNLVINQNLKSINNNNSNSRYIQNLFTRTLLSVILVLGCAIFVNLSDKNLLFFKNNLFNNTISFAKINELYTKYFGNIAPDLGPSTVPVFNNTPTFSSIEQFDNSYKALMNTNVISFLESGIVVFSGEKENLGQTVIIQGIDGVDIWYSNLNNSNLTMYDYVEKGDILGEVNNNEIILTFISNGEYISYEKYIS